MFKSLIILLSVVLACNDAPKSSVSSEAAVVPAAAAVSDTIVPPQFSDGKLVRLEKSDAEWKKQLTRQQYHVLREEGTERPFTGVYADHHGDGIYTCAGCGLPLFDSTTKFESGTGWPSFYQPLKPEHVNVGKDNSLGMSRDEVECARCGGHLGHVFDDGPKPTGLRYCMNSAALGFVPR
jgi:peptide-methionine (R)-S-oxide reductase